PVFHPNGGIVRTEMEEHSRRRHIEAGYSFVNTPHITKQDLFERSGHLGFYKDGMFPPMHVDAEYDAEGNETKPGQDYYHKPKIGYSTRPGASCAGIWRSPRVVVTSKLATPLSTPRTSPNKTSLSALVTWAFTKTACSRRCTSMPSMTLRATRPSQGRITTSSP